MDVQGRIFEVGLMKAAPSPPVRAQQQVGCSVGPRLRLSVWRCVRVRALLTC